LRLALRRFLNVDRPVSPRSDDEIAAEVERNYRWNLTVNLIEAATFLFGASLISSSTIVPLFISKLTSNPLLIGLAAVIAQAGWYLPQLFTANVVERLPHKKPVVVNAGFFSERLPILLLPGVALIAGRSASLALVLFLAVFAWHHLGAGVVATAWQDMVARCFPVDRRGRFFGTAAFLGTGAGIAGAALSIRILKNSAFPINFAYVFALAATCITASWFFIALTREPSQPINVPRQSSRQFWSGLPNILRQDHNFRRFLVARLTLAMGGMGLGFVTVAAVQRWGVPDSTVGVFTAALLLGQTIGNLGSGLLADRYGHKLSLELSALAASLAFTLAWLAPSAEWYYAVFVLLGFAFGAVIVSGTLVSMEFCRPQRRPTYTGMANTSVGLISVILVALVLMRWWVQEPRWVKARSELTEK
jgi:MFS family permease